MTISLMRESLKKLISDGLKDAHAGLFMQRGLPEWNQDDKQAKADLIQKIVKIPAPKEGSLYALAFTRWVQATSDTGRFATLAAGISGRLYTGLNSAGTLETGISTHHTYGMPSSQAPPSKASPAAMPKAWGWIRHIWTYCSATTATQAA